MKLMKFRSYILIVLLFLSFDASAQLFRPLGLGFSGGERQGNSSLPRMHVEGDRIYVCTRQGLYAKDLSADNSTWQLAGFEGVPLQNYARRGSDILALRYNEGDNFLLLSHDSGLTYEDITPEIFRGEKHERLIELAQHPTDPNTLLVSSLYRGLLLSKDFGQTWECLTEFVYGNRAASSIGFHPARPNIIYNSGEGMVYEGHIKISYDNGLTWNDHGNSLGFPGDNCVHQVAFHPANPDRWIAGGEGCVFLTDDNVELSELLGRRIPHGLLVLLCFRQRASRHGIFGGMFGAKWPERCLHKTDVLHRRRALMASVASNDFRQGI